MALKRRERILIVAATLVLVVLGGMRLGLSWSTASSAASPTAVAVRPDDSAVLHDEDGETHSPEVVAGVGASIPLSSFGLAPDPDPSPSYGSRGIDANLTLGEGKSAEGEIDGALLFVHVVSEDSRESVGAVTVQVSVRSSGPHASILDAATGETKSVWTTDAKGDLALRVPADVALSLAVTSSRATTRRSYLDMASLNRGEEREVTVTLRSRRWLLFFGVVVSQEGEQPIPNATVRVNVPGSDEDLLVKTDALGAFVVEVRNWPCEALIEVEGRPRVRTTIVPRHESFLAAAKIAVPRWAALNIHLTAVGDKELDVAGMELSLHHEEVEPPWTQSTDGPALVDASLRGTTEGLTDAEGFCAFDFLLPNHAGLLIVSRAGREFARAWVPPTFPGVRRELAVPVSLGLEVAGILMDKARKEPIAEHEVWAVPITLRDPTDSAGHFVESVEPRFRVATDDSGKFALSGLQPGVWWIGAAPGNDVAPKATLIEIYGSRSGLTVNTTWGTTILGRVVAKRGEVPAGTVVSVADTEGRSRIRTIVAEDGSFELGPVAWDWVDIRARPPTLSGFLSVTSTCEAGSRNNRLELCTTAQLEGFVTDRHGEPLNGHAWIASTDKEARPGTCATTAVRDGHMEFDEIPGGIWDVLFRTPDGWFARVEAFDTVRDGPDIGRLIAEQGALLEFPPPDPERPKNFVVFWHRIPVCVVDGTSLVSVPDGRLEVIAPWSQWGSTTSVSVGRGERKPVNPGRAYRSWEFNRSR